MPTINEQVAQLTDSTPAPVEVTITGPPVAHSIATAERALGLLSSAILLGDPAQIAESLKLLSASINEIAENCGGDPKAQEHVALLQAALPELILHARQALDGEISDAVRAQIIADTERMRSGLDGISAVSIEPADHISGVVERQLACLDTLAESAALQDAQGVVTNLKQLAATQNRLVPLVADYTAEGEDRTELDEALSELESLLPQHVTAAKTFLQDTSEPQSQHRLFEVIDVMRAPLHAMAAAVNHAPYKKVSAVETRQHANAVLLHNASNTPTTLDAAKSVNNSAKELARLAQNIADNVSNTQTRNNLQKTIDELNRLIAAQEAAMAALESDPNNEVARQNVYSITEALLAHTATLIADLHALSVVQDALLQAVTNKDAVSFFCIHCKVCTNFFFNRKELR